MALSAVTAANRAGRDGEWLRVSHFGSFVAEVHAWPDLARIRFDIAALRKTS